MWDLPRPGLKPISPALAGRFLTTAPPGKSQWQVWCNSYLCFNAVCHFLAAFKIFFLVLVFSNLVMLHLVLLYLFFVWVSLSVLELWFGFFFSFVLENSCPLSVQMFLQFFSSCSGSLLTHMLDNLILSLMSCLLYPVFVLFVLLVFTPFFLFVF